MTASLADGTNVVGALDEPGNASPGVMPEKGPAQARGATLVASGASHPAGQTEGLVAAARGAPRHDARDGWARSCRLASVARPSPLSYEFFGVAARARAA